MSISYDHANATAGEHDCEIIKDGDVTVFIPNDHDGRDLEGRWIETTDRWVFPVEAVR